MPQDLNFRWLFDSAPDAMVVVNGQGKITLANPLVEGLFGYTRDELVGQPVEVLIPARYRSAHVQHRDGFIHEPRTRPMGAGLSLSGQRKDGSEFAVEVSLSAIETSDGLLSLAAIRDISERRRTEQELLLYRDHLQELVEERTAALARANERLHGEIEQRSEIQGEQRRLLFELAAANEELQRFAYVVSHDLKAPLRGIDALANWIAADHAPCLGEEGKEQLSLMVGRVHRMNALIDGILEYSRLGRVREQKVPVRLGEAVEEAVDLLAPAPEVKITVRCDLPEVMAERTRMVQVFQNLIGNAIRHNDKEEPRIEVRCEARSDAWQVSIVDNGPGIDPRHHGKVFEMFQTLTSRDRQESTGIGLTLVKRIVENAGGRIWVESEPDGGAAFHFTLPRIEAVAGEAS